MRPLSYTLMLRFVTTTRLAVAIVLATGAVRAIVALGTRLEASSRGIRLVEAVKRNLARLRVDVEDLDLDDVAELKHVFDLVHTAISNARDVQQAVFGGRQLDERTEILDADDSTFVLLAHLAL